MLPYVLALFTAELLFGSMVLHFFALVQQYRVIASVSLHRIQDIFEYPDFTGVDQLFKVSVPFLQ